MTWTRFREGDTARPRLSESSFAPENLSVFYLARAAPGPMTQAASRLNLFSLYDR